MSPDQAVRDLYERNEAAREWTAPRVAEKLGLAEDQVRRSAAFLGNVTRRDSQNLLHEDYLILGHMAAAGNGIRAADVGATLGRPRSAARKKLDALVEGGYLARAKGHLGGYAITDEGRRALAERPG